MRSPHLEDKPRRVAIGKASTTGNSGDLDVIFKIFDATEAVDFATKIASQIQESFPNAPHPATPKSLKKGGKKLDVIVQQTREFSLQHRLNIYTKAKFLNTVKWTLKDSGHEELFVNEVVRLLANILH